MQTHLMPPTRFIYIRHEPPDGKKPYVTRHLVWDVDRFLASQVRQYDEEAKPEDRHGISLATVDDFRKQSH